MFSMKNTTVGFSIRLHQQIGHIWTKKMDLVYKMSVALVKVENAGGNKYVTQPTGRDSCRNLSIMGMPFPQPKTIPISTELGNMNPRCLSFTFSEYHWRILSIC